MTPFLSLQCVEVFLLETLSPSLYISSEIVLTHEQEEPDSAFEATQYFFEDITPETSHGELP